MYRGKSGFTIVELLIVIVVIGILAAITVVTYNGVQSRAQASAVSSGLKQVEKSMRLWAINEGFVTWPQEPTAGGGKSLTDLISSNPSLQNYLQSPPKVNGIHSEEWFYDNEGDEKTNCTNTYSGVNIVIRFVEDSELAQQVDDSIDDGDLTCGKVRYGDNRIFYSLSNTQALYE